MPTRADQGGVKEQPVLPAQRTVPASGLDLSAALLAALSDGYAFTTDGVIAEVNDELCELTGFTREQLLGAGVPFPFWAPDHLEESLEAAQRIIASEGGKAELELQRQNGTRFLASLSARPVRAPDGSIVGFVTVVRDVTAERTASAAVLELARTLADAQRQAGLGSWAWTNGVMTWSDQMYVLLGADPLAGAPDFSTFLANVHPDDLGSYKHRVAEALAGGGTFTAEHRIVRPSGEIRHIYGTAEVELDPVSGAPRRIRGSAQDVTDRVLREQALANSEEQFRLTITSSPIGLALVSLDGRFLQVNDALCRILQRPEPELLEATFQDITHSEDLDADLRMVSELLAGERDGYQIDKRYCRPDGTVVWTGLHVVLVRDHAGQPSHFVSQIVDIDDRRRDAESLARQARTDPLTGLLNRRAWEQSLLDELDHVISGSRELTVAILDLDYFKAFNDTFGHPAGDKLLVATALAWTTYLNDQAPGATLARIGGEEFALALPHVAVKDARTHALALMALVGRGQTASTGLTAATASDEPTTVMTRADAALYAAKHQGRNRCEILLGY